MQERFKINGVSTLEGDLALKLLQASINLTTALMSITDRKIGNINSSGILDIPSTALRYNTVSEEMSRLEIRMYEELDILERYKDCSNAMQISELLMQNVSHFDIMSKRLLQICNNVK